jgi:hypothetical protein
LGDIDTSKAPLDIYRFQKNNTLRREGFTLRRGGFTLRRDGFTVLRAEHKFALAKKRGEEMEVEAAMEKERAMQGANATLNTPGNIMSTHPPNPVMTSPWLY